MAGLRTFIAVPLPETAVAAIGAIQEGLKRKGFRMRWVPPANIHLTLRFLGDIAPSDLPGVQNAMTAAVEVIPPVTLSVKGMGCFPSIRKANVLWAGISGEVRRLKELHSRLEAALETAGMKRDGRPFRGHLTMARIKAPLPPEEILGILDAYAEFTTESFDVDVIVLYRSELGPSGVRYSPLAQAALNG